MVEQVNNLLLNLLISGRGVFLPSVGSLYTRFGGARLLSGRKVERGVREVVYTPQERGVSLIDAIAEAGGCDRAEAADIYARWLSHTLAGEVLTVEGVGELRQQCFTPDPALERLFNPRGKTPVTLHRTTHRGRRIAVATGVVLLLAAGSAYLALFGDDLPGRETIREWVASAGDRFRCGSSVRRFSRRAKRRPVGRRSFVRRDGWDGRTAATSRRFRCRGKIGCRCTDRHAGRFHRFGRNDRPRRIIGPLRRVRRSGRTRGFGSTCPFRRGCRAGVGQGSRHRCSVVG